MGCSFQLGINDSDSEKTDRLLMKGIKEIERIEALLSEFSPDSETSLINNNASKRAVFISEESFNLIERCLSISKLSNGCFDITTRPLKKLYQFKNRDFEFPPKSKIKKTLRQLGYEKIKLNRSKFSIQFSSKNMQISFAAIGKGYASDRVKKIWLEEGVTSGFINASGDLNTIGLNANQEAWKVGIVNPKKPKQVLLYLPCGNASVATSGDYQQHFLYKGKRYSHNIHPKTGVPITGIASVSVCSPSAELSDALATAIYVKGIKTGIDFVNQLPDTHAIIINKNNECFFSSEINYEAI